eukprot:3026079-Prymnesium_polylepis.1
MASRSERFAPGNAPSWASRAQHAHAPGSRAGANPAPLPQLAAQPPISSSPPVVPHLPGSHTSSTEAPPSPPPSALSVSPLSMLKCDDWCGGSPTGWGAKCAFADCVGCA